MGLRRIRISLIRSKNARKNRLLNLLYPFWRRYLDEVRTILQKNCLYEKHLEFHKNTKYAFISPLKTPVKTAKISTMQGDKDSKKPVKLGDVFYYSDIYSHNIGAFYQVVKVYASGRVKIRRIAEKELRWVSDYEKETAPGVNNFLAEDSLKIIKDNQKGAVREIFYDDDDSPYINLGRAAFGRLYLGKPIIESHWDTWVS